MTRLTQGLKALVSTCALVIVLAGLAPHARAAVVAPLPTAAGRAADAAARLLASSASGVTFEVDVPEPRIATLETASGRYQRFDLDGFSWDAGVGQPLLPGRSIWLAVPPGARVRVSAVGEGERVYEGVRIVPQQEASWATSLATAGGRILNAMTEDPAIYGRTGYGDTPLATMDGVTGMRAQRVTRITVRPAAYDPAAGRVRLYARVRVTVTFEGGSAPRETLAEPARADVFEDAYRALLNYESGRAWRVDPGASSLRARGLQPNAVGNGVTGGREDFSASPNWVKLEVTTKGVYKVDAADLVSAGVNLAGVDPRTIRVFTRPGIPLLEELAAPSGWMSEVAVNVVGETDGTFDAGDYVLVFALGSSGWKDEYTSAATDSGYLNHPYETKNFYWLTWGGTFSGAPRRWATRSGAPELPGAWTATDFTARQHFEQDLEYEPNLQSGQNLNVRTGIFWEKWIWLNFTDNGNSIPFGFSLPHAVASRPGRVRARLWGNSTMTRHSAGIADHYLNVSINGQAFPEREFYGFLRQDYDTTFADVRAIGNQFRLQNRHINDPVNPNRFDKVALFWFDIDYPRTFTPTSNVLDFRSPDTTAVVAYGLGPFTTTAGFLLLDTTDPVSPTQITSYVERDTTGGKAIYFQDDVSSKHDYLAFVTSNLRHPDAVTKIQIDDLESPANGADYIVIANDAFASAANALAAHRRTKLPGVANPAARVVKTSDIYAWYSGGRLDPTAIRNFIWDTVRGVGWSPAPSYICFLGDASYDYKDVYNLAAPGQPTNFVPTYPNAWHTAQFSTDDWLVDFDLGLSEPNPNTPPPDSVRLDVPDFATGRIPAASVAEADFLVEDKILPYETNPLYGEWRQRGLMLADDITQGFGVDNLSTEHMRESDYIADNFLPVSLVTRKIFLLRYPYGSGSEKPAVNHDVKEAINQGMVFWNYVGHGNPFKIADENAFILSDVSSLTNLRDLTFLIAASCDLGKFDDAVLTGLGEALIKARNGGAVGTFSSTDIAFAFSNTALAEQLFNHMLEETPEGFTTSLGKAVLLAKLRPNLGVNDNKYVLMGDPGMRLGLPDQYVRIALADAETSAPVDSLRRGRRIVATGTVSPTHDPNASDVNSAFNGVASILVTDSAPKDSISDVYGKVVYHYDPGVIFHGDVPVTNGHFDATFIVPLEALTGPSARVSAYATTGAGDAGGAALRPLTTGTAAVVDTTGPTIGLAFVNGLKVVPPDAKLRIVVRDENGVNLTGHTIPNALYLTIDGLTRYDLTKDFRYDTQSYQSGSVEFTLPGLDPGAHSITVSAADNFAQGVLGKKNRSTASIDFEVIEDTGFSLGRVYNFPNPFRPGGPGTSFVVTGLTEAARVQVKVYTVSGALVRRLEASGGPGQVQIAWDGRDERGDRVANGAYLYQVSAEGQGSGQVVRFRGSAAALE